MVIVLSNTGCYVQNLEIVAQQMINIETNRNIYKLPTSSINKKCKICKIKKKKIMIESHADIDKEVNDYTTKFNLNNNIIEKFNTYKIKNKSNTKEIIKQGSYYNNEIEVETNLKVGQIIIYTHNNFDVKSYLENRCAEYSKNIINKYPINTYLNNNVQSTNYTLLNTYTNYLSRNIICSNEHHSKQVGTDTDNATFVWYYHIVSADFDIYKHLQLSIKKNMDFGLKWLNNNIQDYQNYLNNSFDISIFHLLLSPSTIILDCAKFLQPGIPKSLNYPMANVLTIKNFVPNLIVLSEKFGTIFHIYKNLDLNKKNIRSKNYKYNSINNTNLIIKTAKIVNQMHVMYTFKYKSKLVYEDNLEYDIKKIKKLLSKSFDNEMANVSTGDGNLTTATKCYVTGLPLFGTYLEVYFNIQIKIGTTTKTIMTKMCMSLYGLNILNKSYYNLKVDIFSKNKFNVVSIDCDNTYLISFVSSDISIYSAIDTLMTASTQEKELLKTIEKYGMYKSINQYEKIITYNPEDNQIYFGIYVIYLTDAIILYMQHNSDSILFSYIVI